MFKRLQAEEEDAILNSLKERLEMYLGGIPLTGGVSTPYGQLNPSAL